MPNCLCSGFTLSEEYAEKMRKVSYFDYETILKTCSNDTIVSENTVQECICKNFILNLQSFIMNLNNTMKI